MLILLYDTHSISFNYMYHTIYTMFKNALMTLYTCYENFGKSYILIPILWTNISLHIGIELLLCFSYNLKIPKLGLVNK
jgi:hypothetical protein